ncbi:MAG: hypothetical protein Tsb0021_05900 [Chlamydiales bacterium]
MSVNLSDFQPINRWKPDLDGPKYYDGTAQYLIDQATGRKYLNESKGVVGYKCFLLILGTPIVHTITSVMNVAYRIVKLVTLSHFWMQKDGEQSYNFKNRLKDAGTDLLRIATQPIALVGLELAAIYGLFRPYDGRKLYASIERAQYGNYILAPCFQPNAQEHLLGGDINERNAF